MHKEHLKLSESNIRYLTTLISTGQQSAKAFRRATALLELSRGKSYREIAKSLSVCEQTVAAWRSKYLAHGLTVLIDRPRSGRPASIAGKQRAHLTALACCQAPEGHARWTLRLLAEKAVEFGLLESVSHTAVRKILKKTVSNRT